MSWWDWLWRRKKPEGPVSDTEAVQRALQELGRRHEVRTKKGQVRKHHTDEFRELKADSDPARFGEDLLHLTSDTHQHRRLYGYEEEERVNLSGAKGDATQSGADANRAAEEAKADFEQKGVKMDEHYYRVSERAQTGEVTETYDIKAPKKKD